MNRPQRLASALLIAATFLGACTGPKPDASGAPTRWAAPIAGQEIAAVGQKVGGCSAGDLDGVSGDEIVAVAGDGLVVVAWLDGGEWKHATVEQLPGEAIGVVCLPSLPGHSSFVTVGKLEGDEESPGPGVAYLFSRPFGTAGTPADGWERQTLLNDSALLHGVAASPDGIAMAGYGGSLHWFAPQPGGLMHYEVGSLPGPAKGVAVDGRRVVVACASGELVEFQRPEAEGGTWRQRILWRFPKALARVDAWDGRVAVSSNDGGLYAYEPGLQGDILFYQSSDRLRGAVFLQGPRTQLPAPWFLATAGYDGQVSVFVRPGTARDGIHRQVDSDRLHHLCGARLALPGSEALTPALITCGYSGRILALPFVPLGAQP